MIKLKVSVCSMKAIKAKNKPEFADQLARILNRAKYLREGKALKIYAPKIAGKVSARLSARIAYRKLQLKCGYKKHTVYIWKAKVGHKKPASPAGNKEQAG